MIHAPRTTSSPHTLHAPITVLPLVYMHTTHSTHLIRLASPHVSPRVMSFCPHQHLHRQLTSAPGISVYVSTRQLLTFLQLTVDFDLWLLTKNKKFSIRPILLSFSRRFQFWILFLHLRSLNLSFCSFLLGHMWFTC